ncbi:hypothetical protein ACFQ3K_16800 [Brucella gallinifaecis]|uniref:Uncharacterized protein n=1 Tax=Brucella gallinifaecis TaxID=215590 RepID=A0A502BIX9_9HYPH|nr:hypothetical protein [Brucella gallinifaecis]TPF73857.1 hypothetical protein FHY56_17685 [Brucella gallinifaecis]
MVYLYLLAAVVGAIIYAVSKGYRPLSRLLLSLVAFVALSAVVTYGIVQIGDRPLEGSRIVDPSE